MAIFHPTLDRVSQFNPPPEPGELALLTFLAEHLDNTYEVFFQPMLDGDKPDVAILKRDVGVAVIEVKDWSLNNYKILDDSRWQLQTNGAIVLSPISQVERYKRRLINLYVPEFCAKVELNTRLYGVVSTAVYFHEASSAELSRLFQTSRPKYTTLLGRDSLSPEELGRIIHSLRLAKVSAVFDGDLYTRFRRFLAPPTHTEEQGIPLTYTQEQLKLIPSSAEEKKISGVAGSGKTFVLAKRAVNAYMRTHATVLILTFNITLRNYIHDRISEVREKFEWKNFCITNYHCFFATQADRYELPYSVSDATDEDNSSFDDETFFESVAGKVQRYQSIFIDEVQDYKIEWLRLIRKYFLAPDGEYVLFGDEKQNVYGRTLEDKKIRTNIPGRFNRLRQSQRLNLKVAELATKFQAEFFAGRHEIDTVESMRQGSLFEPHMEYHYLKGATPPCLAGIVMNFAEKWEVHPNDIAVLCSRIEQVRMVDAAVRKHFHQRTTICCETQEEFEELQRAKLPKQIDLAIKSIQRSRRYNFWANAGTMKLSTIHSFKGWEASTLFVVVENSRFDDQINDELIYTALTRCRDRLVVLNIGNEKYDGFFSKEIVRYSGNDCALPLLEAEMHGESIGSEREERPNEIKGHTAETRRVESVQACAIVPLRLGTLLASQRTSVEAECPLPLPEERALYEGDTVSHPRFGQGTMLQDFDPFGATAEEQRRRGVRVRFGPVTTVLRREADELQLNRHPRPKTRE